MSQCWNEDPNRRPSFERLEKKISGFIDDVEEVSSRLISSTHTLWRRVFFIANCVLSHAKNTPPLWVFNNFTSWIIYPEWRNLGA